MTNAGDTHPAPSHEANIIDTLQSLIVAFVLAMTFRGFVTEGFVIPTGSMAPTLMGAHSLLLSEQTGMAYPVGLDQVSIPRPGEHRLMDPNLGPLYPGTGPSHIAQGKRMGDRILVLKCLYPFSEPKRYDVVVFKNPTAPIGDSANYIKRLIGLPNEQVWIADGDVFSKRDGESDFVIRPKPEHVQRAVWQLVHDSDGVPIDPEKLKEQTRRPYTGPPWVPADGARGAWEIAGHRAYRCNSAEPTALVWNSQERALDDWTAYDMLAPSKPALVPVSDVRVVAGIVAEQGGFETTFELQTRDRAFEFRVQSNHASIRMRSLRDQSVEHEWSAPIRTPVWSPGRVCTVEFWHADQSVAIYLNGKRVVNGSYDEWRPLKRLQLATGLIDTEDIDALLERAPQPPRIQWRFQGSPFTLHNVRTYRDLHYRNAMLPASPGKSDYVIMGHAFGTHPNEQLQYGPDARQVALSGKLGPDQFMMCGDNSQMSLDSRLWGNSHPLIQQIDDHPFTVHRKLLLGKAWVVYFPAPFALNENGRYPVIPDFGRLRFIR